MRKRDMLKEVWRLFYNYVHPLRSSRLRRDSY